MYRIYASTKNTTRSLQRYYINNIQITIPIKITNRYMSTQEAIPKHEEVYSLYDEKNQSQTKKIRKPPVTLKERQLRSVDIFKSPIIYTSKYCLRSALENATVNVNRKVALIVAQTKPNEVIQELRRLGFFCQMYTDFKALPTLECIDEGKEIFRGIKPGLVLAVGAKNAMDVAKLILLDAEYPKIYEHYLSTVLSLSPSGKKEKKKSYTAEAKINLICPLVFIPGQLSCGAEMKPYAELYLGEAHTPITVSTCDPDVVIQDSLCIPHFNEEHFTSEAFYLLVQAIEAFVSPNSSDRIKLMAKYSIKVLYENMLKYDHKDGKQQHISAAKFNDTAIRVSAQVGTCVSNASCGLATAMSVACNAHFNISEELSASLFLNDVIEYNLSGTEKLQKNTQKLYAELAEYIGLHAKGKKQNTIYNFINEIENLQQSLGLPQSIKDVKNVTFADYEKAIPELANDTMNVGLLYGNPRAPKLSEVEDLFHKAMEA